MIKAAPCVFCNEDAEYQRPGTMMGLYVFECPICDVYFIEITAYEQLRDPPTIDNLKLSCIGENIAAQKIGVRPFWRMFSDAKPFSPSKDSSPRYLEGRNAFPIIHANKPDDILRVLANSLINKSPFVIEARITKSEMYSLKVRDEAELAGWMHFLTSSRLVKGDNELATDLEAPLRNVYQITAIGWERARKIFAGVDSRKVFIAMNFRDKEARPKIQGAIELACKNTGWEAFTIDKEHFLGNITDEIISKINQSRFIVADFTENNHGVYYEAGYAAGKDIPVIYTVQRKDIDKVHFDTSHINHIVWDDEKDLQTKLESRIGAVINR